MRRAIAFVSNSAATTYRFRRELFEAILARGHKLIVFVPCGPTEDEACGQLRTLGVEVQHFSISRTNSRVLQDFWALLRLRQKFCRCKPDVVISSFLKPLVFGSLAAATARVPHVYSMVEGMGYVFTDKSGGIAQAVFRVLTRLLLRLALAQNEKVFVLNHDDQSELVQKGLAKKQQLVFLDGIGVNLQEFQASPAPISPFRFVFVGRFLREKGVFEYVQAARKLKEKYSHIAFQMVGGLDDNPGSLREKDLQSWQKEGIVEWLGVRKDVAQVLKQSSVFVLPSYREGKPRSTMEAMACGRAVITTDVPGCRETVEHGRNGLVVRARNALALAEAMEQLICNPESVQKMGQASAEMARKRFDVHTINEQFLQEIAVS